MKITYRAVTLILKATAGLSPTEMAVEKETTCYLLLLNLSLAWSFSFPFGYQYYFPPNPGCDERGAKRIYFLSSNCEPPILSLFADW